MPTWNPLGANLAHWRELAKMSRATGRIADKVKVWLAPPEWRPADLGGPVVVPAADPAAHPRYDAKAPGAIRAYVAGQFAVAAVGVMAYLWIEESAPRAFLAVAALVFIATVVAWGGLLERRRWAWPLEAVRLAAGVGLVVWML